MNLELKRMAQLRGLEIMYDEQTEVIKDLEAKLAKVTEERDAYKQALENIKEYNAQLKKELYGETIA